MDREDMYYMVKAILLFIGLAVLAIAIVVAPSYFFAKKSCDDKARIMGVENSYSIFTDCMVKIDEKWQPFNEYNTVNIK